MKSSGSHISSNVLAKLDEYQRLQQQLHELSEQVNGYEVWLA